MARKKTTGGPIPPGNRSKAGSNQADNENAGKRKRKAEVASAQQHDPKLRIGDFEGKATHSIQEPGGKQGADH